MFSCRRTAKLGPKGDGARQADPKSQLRLTKRRSSSGFSILEILVGITIISFVAAAGLPEVRKAQQRTRATAVMNDLRTFAAVFEAYAQERGSWPAETAAGVLPPELVGQLGNKGWLAVTPMGGQYNWENNQMHGGVRYRAALSISETSSAPLEVNEDMLNEIDRLMDDGNLATGNFRIGVNNDPLFILQQ